MPIHSEQIESFFVEEGLKYRRREDGTFLTGFATECYRRKDGVGGIGVVVRIVDDGGSVEFTAPDLYSSRDCRHREALFGTLLAIMMRTRFVRWEHDPGDGEIRCSVEIPVANGAFTRLQFRRMLACLATTIDRWDRVIREAMRSGVAFPPPEGSPSIVLGNAGPSPS